MRKRKVHTRKRRIAGKAVTAVMLATACSLGAFAYADIRAESAREPEYIVAAKKKAETEGDHRERPEPSIESVKAYASSEGWKPVDAGKMAEGSTATAGYLDQKDSVCYYFIFFATGDDASPCQNGMKTKWKKYTIGGKARARNDEFMTATGKTFFGMSALYRNGIMIAVSREGGHQKEIGRTAEKLGYIREAGDIAWEN